jgi:hypothetical protein
VSLVKRYLDNGDVIYSFGFRIPAVPVFHQQKESA